MRIPFDSLTLAAVLSELRGWLGCRVQQASQPDDSTLVLGLYGSAGETWLVLCWHAEFARMHLSYRKPRNAPSPPGFLQAVRAHLVGSRLEQVEQQGFDRVARLVFAGPKGGRTLVLETMGKHSNLALLDEAG
ncbi:MAG: NFACT family protein, partial [Fimbriimonadales bacterium]